MLGLIARAFAFGLVGMIVLPVVAFVVVLATAYIFDSRCGTPGDSGGCEMGAATIAIFTSLPGLAIGVVLAVVLTYRKRTK